MSYIPQKTIKQLLEGVLEALQGVKVLQQAKGIFADLRVNITGGTVTTVSTVSNQSSIGGFSAIQQIPALQNLVAISSNINNIKIT